MTANRRHPAGTPAGGRFAPGMRNEAESVALDDQPTSVEAPDGTEEWWSNGRLHRADGPAVVFSTGTQQWYSEGLKHRSDGPAVIFSDGAEAWYHYGRLHRGDGPAYTSPDGTAEWWSDGRRHRDDGPRSSSPTAPKCGSCTE